MLSLNCPSCQSDRLIKYGKTTGGNQKYKCKSCQKTTTFNFHGRPRINLICHCGKEARAKGLCLYHYQKQWREANFLTLSYYKYQDTIKLEK